MSTTDKYKIKVKVTKLCATHEKLIILYKLLKFQISNNINTVYARDKIKYKISLFH